MSDLKEKFSRWLKQRRSLHPVTPMRAAIVVSACKEAIQNERIDDPIQKERILEGFDHLIEALYSLNCIQQTGMPYSPAAMKKITKKIHNLPLNDMWAINLFIQGGSLKTNSRIIKINKTLADCDRRNIQHFADLARRQARHAKPSLDDLENAVHGCLIGKSVPNEAYDNIMSKYSELMGRLNQINHQNSIENLARIISPEDGPRTAYEMFLCCQGYLLSGSFSEGNTKKYIGFMYISFVQFMDSLWSEFDDMPEEKAHDLIKSGSKIISEVYETHTADIGRMIGLMRFFVDHHEGKVSLKAQAYRQALINKLYENMFLDQVSKLSTSYPEEETELFDINLKWAEQFLIEYKKPNTENVAEEVISNLLRKSPGYKGERLVDEFRKARDSIPPEMEEVTVLYYPENAELRAMRQSFFKYSKLDGKDGPKISFLKFIADNHQSDLEDIGLDEAAIQFMADTGKIPYMPSGEQYPLTVEHINDREYGGTNQRSNLILIPRVVNEQKNKLKLAQLNSMSYKNQGCWIINWVPKRNTDGKYPTVLQAKPL